MYHLLQSNAIVAHSTFNSLRLRRTGYQVGWCLNPCLEVRDICYRPPGTQLNILNGVNLSLREKSFGLIFGKSGSGKTTLLQLLARLNKPTSGSICIQWYGDDGQLNADPELLPTEKVGIDFQFPERFFVADNVLDEITFGWPRQKGSLQLKEQLISNLQRAINWASHSSWFGQWSYCVQ
ncbi:hypothetical protein N665_0187s0027 [Sinapis alba]|nr:hypothetical protein N665_0187s0027 [Sinapis alba]